MSAWDGADLGTDGLADAVAKAAQPHVGDEFVDFHLGVLTAGASGSPNKVGVDGKLMRYLVSYTTHNIGDVVVYIKNRRGECVVLGELQL